MNTRIGVRISPETRSKIDANINAGRFKDVSDFVRKAINMALKAEK